MRTAALAALLLWGPCDKADATAGDGSAATPSATAATATGATTGAAGGTAAAGTGTPAAAGNPGAGGGGGGAGGGVGTQNKGVFANDSGTTVVNDDKKLNFDGGKLTLTNDGGTGTVTQSDAGVVLKGQNGKTLTIPPVPGLK